MMIQGSRPLTRILSPLLLAALVFASMTSYAEEAATCRRVIVSGDPDYPPMSWWDGEAMRGAALDIAKMALDRIGLAYEVRSVGPFPRVLLAARSGEIDLIVEMKNTPERREYLNFTETPIFQNPIALFVTKDSALRYQTWHDLVGLRGGMTQGNRFGGGFDEYLSQNLQIEEATRIEFNFAKLEHDRIDYFVTGYYPGMTWLMRNHRENDFEVLHPWVVSTDNFVGWSRRSPCLARLKEFDGALASMLRSGETERLMRVAIGAWRSDMARLAPDSR